MHKTLNKISWENKKNDLETNHFIYIPEYIQKVVAQRWFYVYEWIGVKDVKESVERDLLKLLSKYGFIWAIFVIFPSVIAYDLWGPFPYFTFFVTTSIINMILSICILVMSIIRSHSLIKNNKVLITDKYISVNWIISQLENNSIIKTLAIEKISTLFEEKIFDNSNIHLSKNRFINEVTAKISEGYDLILDKTKVFGKIWEYIWTWLVILYLAYIISVSLIYFVWILIIWFLWFIISFINKKILISIGHEITTINNFFENIDESSNRLETEKSELIQLLEDAKNNDWKDSLLIKINSGIKIINNQASKSVDQSIDLKILIEKSKYSEMFNFTIYNSWIKKQILSPLEELNTLLDINLVSVWDRLQWLGNQIKWENNSHHIEILSLTKKRLEINIKQMKQYKENLDRSIHKLK